MPPAIELKELQRDRAKLGVAVALLSEPDGGESAAAEL
jgi:hypothetical protein